MYKNNKTFRAEDIANYFINLSLEQKIDDDLPEGITHLKLQKILYFAQAAYLSLYDKPLFEEEIYAWKYGPVVKSIYNSYKKKKNQVLKLPNNYKNNFNNELIRFLNGIWELFSKYSASELINITHSHKPWQEAYSKGENTIIQKETLKKYYKGIFCYK